MCAVLCIGLTVLPSCALVSILCWRGVRPHYVRIGLAWQSYLVLSHLASRRRVFRGEYVRHRIVLRSPTLREEGTRDKGIQREVVYSTRTRNSRSAFIMALTRGRLEQVHGRSAPVRTPIRIVPGQLMPLSRSILPTQWVKPPITS